ncbi:hypothetical protein, partial [Salmonella enterica]|uniref:hypothetical protein n=1 Tax=Salmonella enterica TaxID=28901 RepID=UPI001649C89E
MLILLPQTVRENWGMISLLQTLSAGLGKNVVNWKNGVSKTLNWGGDNSIIRRYREIIKNSDEIGRA